jgi:hypothetical protein
MWMSLHLTVHVLGKVIVVDVRGRRAVIEWTIDIVQDPSRLGSEVIDM